MAVDVVCVASWNVDLIAHIPQPLERGQTRMAQAFDRLPGGKGSNAAIAAARQGAQVGLIARIGGDDFGQMGLDLWARESIDSQHVLRGAGETNGTALILVYEDGDNSIAVYPGAGAGLTATHVQAATGMLAHARVVMASCEVPLAATLAAFEIARAHGVLTLLNPAPATPLPDALWPLVDVLTPNEGELLMLADAPDIETAALRLLQRGVGALVVTLGERGCALFRPDAVPLWVPGHAMQVVDTIGAGDTFTGTLAAQLAQQSPWPQALRWANAAAALSTQAQGAVTAMPARSQVQAWLHSG
ncbi:MAG: ribokinase [Limnohabitans sp.]|jgi:ribokinase|nr:ribokinase [Limnohabitans sp.]